MQTPIPQAIDSSTATWATAPCSAAIAETASSIGIGPQAYTAPAWHPVSTSASTSLTRPRIPRVPSSVVTTTASLRTWARSTPYSRCLVAAPSTISTWQPRERSTSASQNSGAEPYPPPTNTQVTGWVGNGNGRPNGPTRSTSSPALRPVSHRVPAPAAATTRSTLSYWAAD